MGRCLILLLACVAAGPRPVCAQTPADGVELVLSRFESLLQQGEAGGMDAMFAPVFPFEEREEFVAAFFRPDVHRAIVAERDRAPLVGVLPGDGYRVIAELFTESEGQARIVTAMFDLRRPTGGANDTWRIAAARVATSIEGLFRLRVDASSQFAARNLTISSEDLLITLTDGSVFLVDSDAGVTGLILLGRGIMRFTPQPETERGQLRIFAGTEALQADFDTAFVRLNPLEYERRVSVDRLTPVPPRPRDLRRAQDLLAREGPRSFSLDLRDLSGEPWSLLPTPGDFLADIRTRRHGTLTYSRSGMQAEDITLFDRNRRRTIALYPSAARRLGHGLAFNEDDRRDYDVIEYDIEAHLLPDTGFLEGRVRMRLRTLAPDISSLTLRLASQLAVTSIVSAEYGRLLHFRIRNQDSVIVNFPVALPAGAPVTLLVAYSGTMTSQEIDEEGIQAGDGRRDEPLMLPPERSFLLSSRSFWYPQNPITDYATATLRIIVPEGYGCVASGRPRTGDEVTLRDLLTLAEGRSFVFSASDPLRYFALVVSRFVRVGETLVELESGGSVQIAVDANPRQRGRGRSALSEAEAIVRFYAGLVGEAPYPTMNVAVVEHELPGGHSPGYFVLLNNPIAVSRFTWRNDPAAFSGFPEFFIAHEIAHQWWGQAVGWRNYHDQWLSEGLAQYFAALYARHSRGERAFGDMLRQFRRWAIAESDQGPISLGNRLGHIKGEPRVFRALVYNKSAAVLHMLRHLIGDEPFFGGLRRFYEEQKFRKAGTDDLRAAFEAESGQSLVRFFDRWIYGVQLPRLRYNTAVTAGVVTVRFEQVGDVLFDVPVTVSVVYADGRTDDTVVAVTERQLEWTLAADGAVRRVVVNRDHAAVAQLDRR